MTINRRQFLQGSLAASTLLATRRASAQTTLPSPTTGLNLSHFEYDFDLLNDAGRVVPKPVLGLNTSIDQAYAQFDVLRFMNWQKTNVTWMQPPPANLEQFVDRENRADWRVPPLHTDVPFRSINWGMFAGVPLWACLDTAKQAQSHPWVCIPHAESRAAFAPLMQHIVATTFERLEGSGLTPIFEFSNELWNGSFAQGKACAAAQLGKQPSGGSEQFAATLAYQRDRTNELAEFVQSQGLGHVVLSAQLNNPFVAQTLLDGWVSAHVTALAVAPYIGVVRDRAFVSAELLPNGFHPLRHLQTGEPIDLHQPRKHIYAQLATNLSRYIKTETRYMLQQHRQLLDRVAPNMALWAYESGPDLHWRDGAFGNDGINPAHARETYVRFSRTGHIGRLIRLLRDEWRKVNGGLLNGYSSATAYKSVGKRSGNLNVDTFGMFELSDDEPRTYFATPKFKAMVRNTQI